MRHWLAAVALVGSMVSAQTFVVDAANGPGTHFTTIAAAVAAVPDGATLLVRPGVYAPFYIYGKGLTLLGGAGVQLASPSFWPSGIQVSATTATQPVVVRGISLLGWYQNVFVDNCAGPVLLEDVADGPRISPPYFPTSVTIRLSAQVLLRHLDVAFGRVGLIDSHVAMESCSIRGPSYSNIHANVVTSAEAMSIHGGSTQIVDCALVGGQSGWSGPFAPFGTNREAIVTTNADLRVRAPASLTAGGGAAAPVVPVIAGTGTLRLDPAVVLTTTAVPQIGAGLLTQNAVMPAVLAASASPGGTLAASALGPAGSVVILVLGLSGPPITVPGIADTFWIDPAAYYFAAFGVPQPAAPVVATVAVPGSVGLLGVRLAWQSVSVGANGFEASNPTMSLVR